MRRIYRIHGIPNPPDPEIFFEFYGKDPARPCFCVTKGAGSKAFFDGFAMLGELAADFQRIVSLSQDVTDGSLVIPYRLPEEIEWMAAAPMLFVKVEAPEWWDRMESDAREDALLIFARVLSQAGFHPDKKHRLWTGLLKTAEVKGDSLLASGLKHSVPGRLITQFLQAAARDQGGRVADGPMKSGELQPLEPTERREAP